MNDNNANGTITANAQSVSLDVRVHEEAVVQLSGTWVGTLQFEATSDGTNYIALPATVVVTPAVSDVTSATANGAWRLDVRAFNTARVRASAWTSGTATVHVQAFGQ